MNQTPASRASLPETGSPVRSRQGRFRLPPSVDASHTTWILGSLVKHRRLLLLRDPIAALASMVGGEQSTTNELGVGDDAAVTRVIHSDYLVVHAAGKRILAVHVAAQGPALSPVDSRA